MLKKKTNSKRYAKFRRLLYCRCKEEIHTKASGSEIAYVPAPCGRGLNSVITWCNHPLIGLGLWLNQKRMQVKRKQTKKSQQKDRWKAIQLVLKGIEWPDQLRMKRKMRELQVSLPKKRKFVMHRVKIFVGSSLFSFYQGIVRTIKRSVYRKKNILSRYTQILVESLSEPLLRESSLLTFGFTRIVYKLIAPWPGSAVGKKWENMEWNGIKRSRGPFSLVPRLPLNSLGSPTFFSSFEFSPNCRARSQAKLITVQDFVFSKWFCTDIILYFKNRSPPSPPHPDS